MSKELFEKGFEIETKIKGVAVAIKPFNQNSSKKGAQLQFANITVKGLQTIDVKIEAAKEEDLQKFINQFVVINKVNVSKVDFNTYYSCSDISLIKIENIKGA